MKNIEFKNLNKTPVRTKNWLKINDITIENYKMPKITPFNNLNIKDINGIEIIPFEKNNIFSFSKNFDYGVSKELINQGEKDFNQGYLVKINKDLSEEEAAVIEFNIDKDNSILVDNIIIVAEENTKGKIILVYKSVDDTLGYHNGVCKVFCKENSDIQLVNVNLLNKNTVHINSTIAEVKENGNVDFISIDLGGKYSITNYHGDLIEDKSNSRLNSLYLGGESKVIDINYIMSHKGKYSNSEIITKGALKDKSSKIFRGTLDFKRGAEKSVGNEEEYCMLLSKKAKSKAVPLLLCEEYDVSGEHAASSGKIDEDKLFYLMSRGLSFLDARLLIIEATFNPIIDKIKDEEIKNEILKEVKEQLKNE
ncbi:Fe-S cluster assembly protein SufD [Clostridium carnis]